jgi:hypothetical protein
LTNAGVRFVVVGGVAAGINGSARATFDLDICYDPAPENAEKLARVLADWHAYLRGVEPGLPFIMDAKAFRITPVMTLTTDMGPLDVMDRVAGVGDFDKVFANSFDVAEPGFTFRALTLASLIDAKRAAGRRKDRDQLPELEALLARISADRGRSK